jgi:peroxiredoxin Q/BCP
MPAPAFDLSSTTGDQTSLAGLAGKNVVLYFYPKDDTPGCTAEACDFRNNFGRLSSMGVEVLGVSKDSVASHQRFRQKHGLPFHLLSDADNSVAQAYGAYGAKNMYGKRVTGTIRSTVLIDDAGRVKAVWSPVKVAGHVDQVIARLLGPETAVLTTDRISSTSKGKPTTSAREHTKDRTPSKRRTPTKKNTRKPVPTTKAAPSAKATKKKAVPTSKAGPTKRSGPAKKASKKKATQRTAATRNAVKKKARPARR